MIDWFTVAAQIINFLILVALLKYFLYGRIVEAMDRREQSIADRWNSAEQREEELHQELDHAKQQTRELEAQRDKMMDEIRDEAESFRDELKGKARKEAENAKSLWAESIREETDAFLKDLRKRSSEQILAIVRKVLTDLADSDLEGRILHAFLNRLEELDERERTKILDSLEANGSRGVIQTTFEPPGELKEKLSAALKKHFGEKLELRFELSDDLICGIALQTNSHKVAWDLGDYLRSFDEEIRQTLEEETADLQPASESNVSASSPSLS